MPGRHIAFQAAGAVADATGRLGQGLELEADYVVVGSGAGGSAAAITLQRGGFSTILIESGPWRDPEDYPSSMYGTMRDMFTDWGQLIATGDSIIPVVQAQLVGGTPVINSAIVVRTPGDVLQDWRDRLGLGDAFSERKIGDAQDKIEQQLKITQIPVDVLGPTTQRMLDGFQRVSIEGHIITRNVHDCQGSMQCLQGCRNRAKQTPNITWIPELMALGGHVLSCAPVHRVRVEKGQAVGVHGWFRHPENRSKGEAFSVRAKRGVLVAASATGSAPLLMRSGLDLPYLGQGWRAHPGAGVVGIYPDFMDMHKGPSQAAASIHHRLDVGIKMEHLSLPLELFAARVGGGGSVLMNKLEEYRHCAMWVTAVRAQAVGRLRHGWLGTRLHYVPTAEDLSRLRFGTKLLARMHFEAGAERVWHGVYGLKPEITKDELDLIDQAPLDNKAWTWVLSHLFGGCVLGTDPATSVVGPDLHVHGVRRLHVVDASAIPTTLGVNPQHTIMAMAMVTAQTIAG